MIHFKKKTMHPLKCSHCILMQTNSSQVTYKYDSQLHFLICMLNIAICRTCPEAKLARSLLVIPIAAEVSGRKNQHTSNENLAGALLM